MSLMIWLRRGPVLGVVVITAMTLALVGGVIFAATGAGCKVGLKLARCAAYTAAVGRVTPSPTRGPGQPAYQYNPPPLPPPASAPYAPPPYGSPAYPPPDLSSNPAPPTRDPSWPPYQYDASSAFPPIYSVSSEPLPSNLALSCRLPVYASGPGSGGFIEFPARAFVADPHSAVNPPAPPAGYTPPPPGPYGQGGPIFGISYDRALGKWLPVPHNLVSPDGTRYAYVFPGDQGIYIIDASSGAQTEIGDGKPWIVLALDATSVYATVGSQQGPLAGLWQLPYSGTPREIATAGYWTAVGGGAAYGTSTSAVPQGATNMILRLDLKTGSSQPWFTVDHSQASVTGFDPSGSPLIVDNVQTTNPYGYQTYATVVWDVPGIGTGFVIASNPPFGWPSVADSHGVWFPGGSQTYLFIRGQGVFVVANIGGNPAGECAA